MIRQLKSSCRSSNFWSDLATVGAMICMVATAVLSDPNVAADLAWKQGLIAGLYKLSNMLSHIYNGKEFVDESTVPNISTGN